MKPERVFKHIQKACPFCGVVKIEAYGEIISFGSITRYCKCNNCGGRWVEQFSETGEA